MTDLDLEKWSVEANDAIKISLLPPSGTRDKALTFPPAFTYAIFGTEKDEDNQRQHDEEAEGNGETIFGYQDLKIRLDFAADTMRPNLKVTWAKKLDTIGDVHADEPENTLREFMPALEDSVVSDETTRNGSTFSPPGKMIHSYKVEDRNYGIWAANLSDPAAKRLLRSMQILVLFFIEGASMIELDDVDWTIQRWTVFFMQVKLCVFVNANVCANKVTSYEILPSTNTNTYSFVGYSTAYRLFFLDIASESPLAPLLEIFPDDDPNLINQLPCRERISQFLILPPYQSHGHGSNLYNTMVSHFLANPQIRTITVEDPNEHFDDLRDFNDLIRLRQTSPDFLSLKLNTSTALPAKKSQPLPISTLLPTTTTDSIARTSLIAPRQLARLTEMHLLSTIPAHNRQVARTTRKDKASDLNDRAYYFWRLLVKHRLYKHNLDQLAQLEPEERVEKLDQALSGVENDYIRILEEVERRVARLKNADVSMKDEDEDEDNDYDDEAKSTKRRRRLMQKEKAKKRKIVEDEDEDEEAAATQASSSSKTPRSKKKRMKAEIVDLD